MVQVEDRTGSTAVDDWHELESLIQHQINDGVMAFTLNVDGRYPMLMILVNGDAAYAHYFEEEETPGFAIKGTLEIEAETVQFATCNGTEVQYIDSASIVGVSEVMRVAEAFSLAPRRLPSVAEWLEL